MTTAEVSPVEVTADVAAATEDAVVTDPTPASSEELTDTTTATQTVAVTDSETTTTPSAEVAVSAGEPVAPDATAPDEPEGNGTEDGPTEEKEQVDAS